MAAARARPSGSHSNPATSHSIFRPTTCAQTPHVCPVLLISLKIDSGLSEFFGETLSVGGDEGEALGRAQTLPRRTPSSGPPPVHSPRTCVLFWLAQQMGSWYLLESISLLMLQKDAARQAEMRITDPSRQGRRMLVSLTMAQPTSCGQGMQAHAGACRAACRHAAGVTPHSQPRASCG